MQYEINRDDHFITGQGFKAIVYAISEAFNVPVIEAQSRFDTPIAQVATEHGVIRDKSRNLIIQRMVGLCGGNIKGSIIVSGSASRTVYKVHFKHIPEAVEASFDEDNVVIDNQLVEQPQSVSEGSTDTTDTTNILDVAAIISEANTLFNGDNKAASKRALVDFAAKYDVLLVSGKKTFITMLSDFEQALNSK